jgi:hypothetical protein
MATLRSKGTVLKVTLASVLTPLSQVTSLDLSGSKAESVEVPTLDDLTAYKPKMNTGLSDGGKVAGELYFDPALAAHTNYKTLIDTPPTSPTACAITFANSPVTTCTFSAVGFGLDVSISLKNPVTGKFSMDVSGGLTFATAT